MSSRHDKLVDRFLTLPRDFRWRELVRLLAWFGYILLKPGKTSGSVRRFKRDGFPHITAHEPHPGDIVPMHTMRRVRRQLKERGLI